MTSRRRSRSVSACWSVLRTAVSNRITSSVITYPVHFREVNNDAVVTHWGAGHIVTTPRTATRRSFSRAKFTASMTSTTPVQRAMIAGRLYDHPVPDCPCLIVLIVAWRDRLASKPTPGLLECVVFDLWMIRCHLGSHRIIQRQPQSSLSLRNSHGLKR